MISAVREHTVYVSELEPYSGAACDDQTEGRFGTLSGLPLPAQLVANGRARERLNMASHGVFDRVMRRDARGKCVRGKWRHDFKGEEVRCRFVAMQFAKEVRHYLFAGTPPLKFVPLGV